jgi:hypothetical protein
VSVSAGAILGGSGSIAGAVSGAGTVDAGASPEAVGTLTFGSSLAVTGGLRFDLDGVAAAGADYDRIVATGSVTQAGVLTIDIGAGFLDALNADADRTATLALFTGSSLTGSFSSIVLTGIDTNTFSGNSATGNSTGILYTFNADGTLTVVSAIPEPSAAALIAGAGAVLGVLIVRRRRPVSRRR